MGVYGGKISGMLRVANKGFARVSLKAPPNTNWPYRGASVEEGVVDYPKVAVLLSSHGVILLLVHSNEVCLVTEAEDARTVWVTVDAFAS